MRIQFAGRDLTMKGFRLKPLKTLEEKVLATPGRRGLVIPKPKLLFVGDDGRSQELEPPPQEISVDLRCDASTRSLLRTRSATPSWSPAGAGRREDDSDHDEPDADRCHEKSETRHHGGHRKRR